MNRYLICGRCGNKNSSHTINLGTWKIPHTNEKTELCENCYQIWNKIWLKTFKKPRINSTPETNKIILSLFLGFMNMKVKVILI